MAERIATYRLQFRGEMDFDRAIELIPYFKRLGVSHLYASPLMRAESGSAHGYDVVDYNEIEPAIGGRAGFERLSAALKEAGLGLVLDIVPNHMAASVENPWWRDVLEWGPRARHARHFDINWSRRLTLPFIGGPLEEAIENDELSIGIDSERRGLVLRYYESEYPLTPTSYTHLTWADPESEQLTALAEAAERATPEAAEDFHAEMRERLEAPGLAEALAALSADRTLITRIHDAQPWMLMDWHEARRDLSYRRFFEVTGLVGTRVEDALVFDDVHRLVFELVSEGHVDGLRVDHVDGLSDPAGYLRRLREAVGPDVWLLVEKIVEGHHEMLRDWPIEGTTGYEFIAAMADLLQPREGVEVMHEAYSGLTSAQPAAQRRDAAKRLIVTQNFEGELAAVVALLQREQPDLDEVALRDALVALIVALPVYRTYGDPAGFSDEDLELLRPAVQFAAEMAGSAEAEAVFEALATPGAWELRARFQQLTGPAMAKAVEDTLFYRHTPILANNEVGCDPVAPPSRSFDVHAELAARGRREPFGLLTTSSHDTKRGEDARARLYAITSAPADWISAVERWRGWAAERGPGPAPDPATEWTVYQALAGIWPEDHVPDADELAWMGERFTNFLVKALREAKMRTSWTDEDAAYEESVTQYAAALLDAENQRFIADFQQTLEPYIQVGRTHSLAQTLVKLTAPGVPDIYQGSEGGDYSLVDPDNRRPPDFAAHASRLDANPSDWSGGLADQKARIIAQALAERGRRPALYTRGQYEPLAVHGPFADAFFAFQRRDDGGAAAVLVPTRGVLPPAPEEAADWSDWDNTVVHLPDPGPWRSAFGGSELGAGETRIADMLAGGPVALLLSG